MFLDKRMVILINPSDEDIDQRPYGAVLWDARETRLRNQLFKIKKKTAI